MNSLKNYRLKMTRLHVISCYSFIDILVTGYSLGPSFNVKYDYVFFFSLYEEIPKMGPTL